jgi:class 3 adenylate cyclase
MVSNIPTGTVTFLFTDIEGLTKLWEQHPEAMKKSKWHWAGTREIEGLNFQLQYAIGSMVM